MAGAVTISIDVVSDVICPWCFLGKRRLDKAITALDGLSVEVTWRPFLLDPTIPAEGLSRRDYLAAKFGPSRLESLHDPLLAAAREDGVPYNLEAITRTPSSRDAHRVIRWAHVAGRQNAMAERLFMAYWSEGKDVGAHEVLAKEAAAVGMDGEKVLADLATDLDADKVMGEIAMAGRMGINGVPTFVIGRKYAVVGAQSAEVLADAIRQAVAEGLAVPA